MLCKVPAIKKIFNSLENEKHRGAITAAIKAQNPFLERMRGESGLGSAFELVNEHIFSIAGKGEIRGRKLPVPEFPDESFRLFCREVCSCWDETKKRERISYGITYPWNDPSTGISRFFSAAVPKGYRYLPPRSGSQVRARNRYPLSMSVLLIPISDETREMALLSLIRKHTQGDGRFAPISDIFGKMYKGERLARIMVGKWETMLIGAGGTRIAYPHENMKSRFKSLHAGRAQKLRIAAARMSLGFNDGLWPRPSGYP